MVELLQPIVANEERVKNNVDQIEVIIEGISQDQSENGWQYNLFINYSNLELYFNPILSYEFNEPLSCINLNLIGLVYILNWNSLFLNTISFICAILSTLIFICLKLF